MHKRLPWILIPLLFLFLLNGCQTYYQRYQQFNEHFRQGQLEEAQQLLAKDKKGPKRRTRLLFLLNQGMVNHLLKNYELSNRYFEEAYILSEDYLKNYADEALAIVTNPKLTEYKGEDFELLMIHYYKALNFLHMGNYEAALVECRRMGIRQNLLSDKFKSENRYRRDAFIHNLMGMIYEASGNPNDAFIAYRNALEIYEEDYSRLFGIEPPQQLREDLLRTAHQTGFRDQVTFFEKKFDQQLRLPPANHGTVVLLWQNGLGPVKHEWSINFTLVRGAGGRVDFVNEELGLSFPFFLSPSQSSTGNLGDLRIIRVAFPKYVEREPIFRQARISSQGHTAHFELAQNINAIAIKSLEDRMLREMGTALLRLAIKQASEQAVRKKDENLGAVLSILNTVTEQADTRNWQTLPHQVQYTRLSLPPGQHALNMELLLPSGHTARTQTINVAVQAGKTVFVQVHTLDSKLPGQR